METSLAVCYFSSFPYCKYVVGFFCLLANYRPLPRSHPDDIPIRVEQQQERFGITGDLSIRCGSFVNPKTGAGLAVLVGQGQRGVFGGERLASRVAATLAR